MPPRGGEWHTPRSSSTVQGAGVLPGRALSLLRGDIPALFSPPHQADHGTTLAMGLHGQGAQRCGHLARLSLSFCWAFSLHGCAGKLLQQGVKNPLCSESLQNGYIFWSPPWDACPHLALLDSLLA